MRSKSINKKKKVADQIRLDVLKLKDELEMIVTEHDFYSFATEHEVENWISSMPIEDLNDSIRVERGSPLDKYSLSDMKLKSKLRKDFYKASKVLDVKINKMNIAHIDVLLAKVDGYINEI